jgi:hypothetical protein
MESGDKNTNLGRLKKVLVDLKRGAGHGKNKMSWMRKMPKNSKNALPGAPILYTCQRPLPGSLMHYANQRLLLGTLML